MRGPEKEIEYAILGWLDYHGFFCYKNERVGTYDTKLRVFRRNKNKFKIKGISDIHAFMFGRFIACEVKSKTGTVSPDQRKYLVNVNSNGGVAFVARSLEGFLKEIIKHFPEHPEFQALVNAYLTSPDDKH